jgi:hypothetical protein
MEHISYWRADSRSGSQEIPCLLRKPKVNYRVYKEPPLVHVFGQMNPVHTFPPCFSDDLHKVKGKEKLSLCFL